MSLMMRTNMIHRMSLFTKEGVCQSAYSRKELAVKRYHQELERTKRVHRSHLREVHNWPKKAVDCECELQVGRFRKQKAFGCGKSRCLLCHYGKLMKIATIKARI